MGLKNGFRNKRGKTLNVVKATSAKLDGDHFIYSGVHVAWPLKQPFGRLRDFFFRNQLASWRDAPADAQHHLPIKNAKFFIEPLKFIQNPMNTNDLCDYAIFDVPNSWQCYIFLKKWLFWTN